MPPPVKMIIDTDPGVDDAMAILYALSDPEIDLIGLTSVFGNVTGAIATRNALALVELAGAETPVAAGASVPMVQDLRPPADFVHGVEGFGDALLPAPTRAPDPRPAHVFIAETILAHPGEVVLVPVGPLTNIAMALDHAPEIAKHVARVVVMGGAVRHKGNASPVAEANIWQDPHAAAKVFAADWPMTLIGLDVTEQVICTAADLAPMVEASPKCGTFLAKAADFYFKFHKESADIDGCHLHDPAAVIAALDPSLFQMLAAPLTVTVDGEEAGRTQERAAVKGASLDGPPVDIALGVDKARVLDRFRDHLASGRLP